VSDEGQKISIGKYIQELCNELSPLIEIEDARILRAEKHLNGKFVHVWLDFIEAKKSYTVVISVEHQKVIGHRFEYWYE